MGLRPPCRYGPGGTPQAAWASKERKYRAPCTTSSSENAPQRNAVIKSRLKTSRSSLTINLSRRRFEIIDMEEREALAARAVRPRYTTLSIKLPPSLSMLTVTLTASGRLIPMQAGTTRSEGLTQL